MDEGIVFVDLVAHGDGLQLDLHTDGDAIVQRSLAAELHLAVTEVTGVVEVDRIVIDVTDTEILIPVTSDVEPQGLLSHCVVGGHQAADHHGRCTQ